MDTMRRIGILGVGLIGGSLALDLKRKLKGLEVLGVDASEANLELALERGVIDRALTRPGEELRECDVVVFATPLGAMESLMAACEPLLRGLEGSAILTDVGSAKRLTLSQFKRRMPGFYPRCVAAHPIAGSDRSGAGAARFGLFEGKKTILCRHEGQDAAAFAAVEAMWRAAGASTLAMDAQAHDAALACVSHLPHLLSFAYVDMLDQTPGKNDLLELAGTGFRDFTRIAQSSPDMWADISAANADALIGLIDGYAQTLGALRGALRTGDKAALKDMFKRSKALREAWQAARE